MLFTVFSVIKFRDLPFHNLYACEIYFVSWIRFCVCDSSMWVITAGTSYKNTTPEKCFITRLLVLIQLPIKVAWKLKASVYFFFNHLTVSNVQWTICHRNWLIGKFHAFLESEAFPIEPSEKTGKRVSVVMLDSAVLKQEYPDWRALF